MLAGNRTACGSGTDLEVLDEPLQEGYEVLCPSDITWNCLLQQVVGKD